jgi:glutamate 5-kinase
LKQGGAFFVERFNEYLNRIFSMDEQFNQKRFVIKLGSSTVVDAEDNIKTEVLDRVASQASLMVDRGFDIAIVTSGAVACGRKRLGVKNGVTLVEKQELAAAGSTKLFTHWAEAFQRYGKVTMDHLLSEHDVTAISEASPKGPLLRELEKRRAIPVINANDSVNTTEISRLSISGDNDCLSAFVARLIQAGGLILLTEAEGVWDINRKVIANIKDEDDLKMVYAETKTSQGTGGIESKIEVASAFAKAGRSAWITGGHIENVIIDAMNGMQVGTRIKIE